MNEMAIIFKTVPVAFDILSQTSLNTAQSITEILFEFLIDKSAKFRKRLLSYCFFLLVYNTCESVTYIYIYIYIYIYMVFQNRCNPLI